jgi:WD40 repeat protein
MSAYERTGGVHGAVARLAERAYARLDAPQREAARRILLRLAGEGEGAAVVRRRARIDELEADRDPVVAAVLTVLADERLVTVGEGEAEVAHEALLREWPRLRGWLEEDAQARRLQLHLRAAARGWDAGGRDAGELYRGARLASTLEWAGTHEADLNATERDFLAESAAAANRSQRRLRAVLAGVSALLVVAVIAGAVALHQRANARSEATAAEAQRLGARALLDPQLDRALLLAGQGVALDDSARTRGNLLGTLLRSPAAVGVIRAGSATVESAAVDPRAHVLAVGDNQGRIQLFDTGSRRRLRTLEPTGNASDIRALAFSPDGALLAAQHTSVPGTTAELPPGWRAIVTVLDARTDRIVRRIELPRDHGVSGVWFSPDGTLEVPSYGDAGGRLLRFDARTGRRRGAPVPFDHPGRLTFDPFQLWPRSPAFTTAGGREVFVGEVGGVTVRDAATLAVLRRFPQASQRAIGTLPTAYAATEDGRVAAIGGENGTVRLLDLRDGTLRQTAGRHRGAVNEVAFAPGGHLLVSTSEDGQVTVWDARSGAQAETLSGHTRSAFSPSFAGGRLYTASLDGTVIVWDVAGRQRLGRTFRAGPGAEGAPRYALSSDGTLLAHGGVDGTIDVVDMRTLRRRANVPVFHETGIAGPALTTGTAFVPGTHEIAVGSNYGGVALVDADRGAVVKRLRGHAKLEHYPHLSDNPIWTPGVSADGRLLASTSSDGMVNLWSLPEGRRLGAPIPLSSFRYGGASDGQLSPDGRWLAVQTLTREVVQDREEIWDVRTRKPVRVLRLPGGVSYARFSPDGRLLAVADLQRRMHLYSTATWKPATDFVVDGGADWTAFSPDSATLATGSGDGTVRLFDAATGQALASLPGPSSSSTVPMFMPGGTSLVAGEQTGTATLWDLRPASLERRACEIAGRRLTRAEWAAALPGRSYDPAC